MSDDADPLAHPLTGESVFAQAASAGLTWRSYEESMPSPCRLTPSGGYAVKHNPAAYFTAMRAACRADDVPLAPALASDIAAGRLPSFAFITPNLCHDTHDCPVATGDGWLSTWVARLLDGPDYRAGTTVVVITWDEGVGSANRMPTIVIAPTVPSGTVSHQAFDHYSLLRTTEELLGLPALGRARAAASMTSAFHL